MDLGDRDDAGLNLRETFRIVKAWIPWDQELR